MIFGRKLTVDQVRQIGEKKTALTAVGVRQLFGFSASWAKHIVVDDCRIGKVLVQFPSLQFYAKQLQLLWVNYSCYSYSLSLLR